MLQLRLLLVDLLDAAPILTTAAPGSGGAVVRRALRERGLGGRGLAAATADLLGLWVWSAVGWVDEDGRSLGCGRRSLGRSIGRRINCGRFERSRTHLGRVLHPLRPWGEDTHAAGVACVVGVVWGWSVGSASA